MIRPRVSGAVDEVVRDTFQMRAERLGLTQSDALQEAIESWLAVPEEVREEANERGLLLAVVVEERLCARRRRP